MNDLETDLRSSLHRYGASITPSPPPPPSIDEKVLVPTFSERTMPATRRWSMVAAAILLAATVPIVLLTGNGEPSIEPLTTEMTAMGEWQRLPQSPLSARKQPSVVWTGIEFIVWGGSNGNPNPLSDGAAFEPTVGTWRKMASSDRVHPGANAVWAGDRMVVLAGRGGEAYDPNSNSWSSLPVLDGRFDGAGFTDAVWVAGVLFGIGVERREDGSAQLSVWTLGQTADRWSHVNQIIVNEALPTASRLVSVNDQFEVFNPIPTDDGFVLWSGVDGGWRFRIGEGWSRVPVLPSEPGRSISETVAAWFGGRLVVVASIQQSGGNSMEVAELDGSEWTPFRKIGDVWFTISQALAIQHGVVLIGVNSFGFPLLIDLKLSSAVPMNGFPVSTTIDQGAAWSGAMLLVWGGQTPTTSEEMSSSDPGPISADGAIWRP